MTTVPLRPSIPVVAPHTSSTNSARMGSGMWTVKAVSARSGRQATVPVMTSTGSWRTAASLVLDSPSSTVDPFLLGVIGDTMLATYRTYQTTPFGSSPSLSLFCQRDRSVVAVEAGHLNQR